MKKRVDFQCIYLVFWVNGCENVSKSPSAVPSRALWASAKSRSSFCEWHKVFKPNRFDDLCAVVFTFHSTRGLRAANSPHQLPKQSPLNLTAGRWILSRVHRDRCQATGALLPDSWALETADMDWISPRTTLTQPPLLLKKTVSYESYWRLATQGEREGWCQQQKWYL